MPGFNRWVVTHPWLTSLVFLGLTVVLASRIPRLHLETDTEAMMPKWHPVFQFNTWVEDYFNIENPALVGVVNTGPDGVFTPETLAVVARLSDQIKALPSIDADDLVSLSEVDNITGDAEGMEVAPFFETPPTTPEGARAVRDAVFANDMMIGSIVSRDGQATLIIAEMLDGGDKVELYAHIRRIIAATPMQAEQVFIGGRPVLEGEMALLARSDLTRMFPFVILAAGLVLWVTLRSLRGALLPLLVVVTSVVWSLGLMAWVHATFHAITSLMPTLLIAIGIANGIHIIHHFLLETGTHPDRPRAANVFNTMQAMTRPVVMTSLTTGAGFLSLSLSPLRPVQTFGVFAAAGVMAAMVFSLTILPALLVVLPAPGRSARRALHTQQGRGGIVAGALGALGPVVTRRPGLLVACGVAGVLAGLAGLPRVVVNGSMLLNFPRDNVLNVADAALRKHFIGTHPLQIVLDAGEVDAWKDPTRLRAVEAFQRHLEASGHMGRTRSIVDFVTRMNEVMNPEDPHAHRVPDSRDLVAQYLLLYSMSGEPDDFDDVVDYDYAQANLRTQVATDHSVELQGVFEDIRAYSQAHLTPLGIEVRTAGAMKTMVTFIDLIITGQVRSLVVALVLVALLTGVMCRAPVAGLYAILPVSIATVMNFGILGWFGIHLGVATALISSIGIGIGIDYAIHYMVRYQRACQSGVDPDTATRETLNTSGVAIFYNAVVVFVGFTVLATSRFPPNRSLGIVVALNMVVCFLGTVTLLAAVLHRTPPRFLQAPASERDPAT